MITTVEQLKAAVSSVPGSSLFFSRATMKGFSTRVSSNLYQAKSGVVFVTSERDTDTYSPAWDGQRRYTIHYVHSDGTGLRKLSNWGQYKTWSGAHQTAARWADGMLDCMRCGEPAGEDYHIVGVSAPARNVTCDNCWDERLR